MFTAIKSLILNRFGSAMFSNTLGTARNKEWREFHNSCKYEFDKSESREHSKAAEELRKDRLSVLANVDVKTLASEVNSFFGDSKDVYSEIPALDAVNYAPEIYGILKSVEGEMKSYYGSYFQPYWISIQRTTPGKTSAATSFGWHIDDNPKELMKLFVYLNDVREENGAFRAFSWKHSRAILLKGFKSDTEVRRVDSQSIADTYFSRHPQSLKVLEGQEGTILAFDNNLVHKGTAPRMGFRHAIQIPVYPAMGPVNLGMVERALLSPRKRDYPENPIQNDFGY